MGKPKKSKPHRSRSQEESDRRNIARLYLQGRYQADIAEELGISQSTVSRDIEYLIAEWKKERVYDINEAKARELAKIDNLEVEYWEAWQRSKEEYKIKRKKATSSPDGTRKEQEQRIEERVGTKAYLDGVQWCIEMRCKILGIEAPKKIGGPGEGLPIPISIVEIIKTYEAPGS